MTRYSGSSPRVRGTSPLGPRQLQRRRLIPACAGNIAGKKGFILTETAHPRVCGEHVPLKKTFTMYHGSSPRVRGT